MLQKDCFFSVFV